MKASARTGSSCPSRSKYMSKQWVPGVCSRRPTVPTSRQPRTRSQRGSVASFASAGASDACIMSAAGWRPSLWSHQFIMVSLTTSFVAARVPEVHAVRSHDNRAAVRYDAEEPGTRGGRMQRMTTAEATVAALAAHGIGTVYALPGVHNDPLFDALFKAADRIRTVHTRHEQGAAYMALGAALATGKPQVYSVVPGPGLLNSASPLLTAYGMNAPVLGLIGQIPQAAIGRGLGHLHEIRDQGGIIARLVDFSARIRTPTHAAARVAQALRAMRSGRPGPAVLECAIDVWGRSAAISAPTPVPSAPQESIDEDAIGDAARRLATVKRPLIVAG